MPIHHFISYSTVDGADFALKLHDALKAGPPSSSVWLDRRHLEPGRDWDVQLAEAIRDCEGLIFVLTRDSVEDASTCKAEWTHALKYKKPITPLLLHRNASCRSAWAAANISTSPATSRPAWRSCVATWNG